MMNGTGSGPLGRIPVQCATAGPGATPAMCMHVGAGGAAGSSATRVTLPPPTPSVLVRICQPRYAAPYPPIANSTTAMLPGWPQCTSAWAWGGGKGRQGQAGWMQGRNEEDDEDGGRRIVVKQESRCLL